jgi:hypothetical protein
MKHEWYAWGGVIMATGLAVAMGMSPAMCRHIDKVDATDHLLKSVLVASKAFKIEFGNWPSSMGDLTNNAKGILFMDSDSRGPVDAWGHRIVYMPFNQQEGFGLAISWGADGKPGGVKQDRDRVVKIE